MGTNTKPSMIDDTKRLLITVGAAVAANGGALITQNVSALMKADVPLQKIHLAASIGHCVKERPAQHMMSVADALVETTYETDKVFRCSADETTSTALCQKTILLVSAGAAMAANCEPCLNALVPRMIEAGISEEDMRAAVVIGKQTQDTIKDSTWAATTALMKAEPFESPGCGCNSSACNA